MITSKILKSEVRHLERAYESMKERHNREEGIAYAKIIEGERARIASFSQEVAKALSFYFRDCFEVYYSTVGITVKRKDFEGEYPYQRSLEIASFSFKGSEFKNNKTYINKLQIRKINGNSPKLFYFNRDVDAKKLARYILKYSFEPKTI